MKWLNDGLIYTTWKLSTPFNEDKARQAESDLWNSRKVGEAEVLAM
jgi:hypothetical protein